MLKLRGESGKNNAAVSTSARQQLPPLADAVHMCAPALSELMRVL
jgi:hypothetical protein